MGNTQRQKTNSQNQLEVKTEALSQKSLSPPLGKIKGRFKQEREFLIFSPSIARRLVKKGNRFYKIQLTTLLSYADKIEIINNIVPAFKDRKLICQALCLNSFFGKNEEMKKLALALNSQRNISNLSLHFDRSPALTKQGMKFFVSGLRRALLSELNISFPLFTKVSIEVLLPLFSGFKHLTCLSSLTLNFCFVDTLKLPAIREFTSSLKRMKRLDRLKITIKDSLIEEKAIKELLSSFGKLKHTSHLSFEYSRFSGFFNASLFNDVPTMLTSLRCLTSLELVFDLRLSGDKKLILTRIFSGLKSLTSLKNLTLSLFPREQRYVECGVEILSEIKTLQKLDLYFSLKEFNKQYFDKLSSGFKDLEMLKYLTLSFCFDKVSDQGIEDFSLVFPNMKALNVLRLKFLGHKFDKKTIHILYENLQRVCSLKHFFLEIYTKEVLEEKEKKKFISKFGDVKVELIKDTTGDYLGKWGLHFYL